MSIILTIISDVLLTLLAAYVGIAFAVAWRHRDWSLWRFLPLVAAIGMVAAIWAHAYLWLVLPLLAAVCVQAWRGRAWLDRSLRMLSTFWLLWISLFTVLERFRA